MSLKKLEIGGGLWPQKGYLQMDAKKVPGVDVVGNVLKGIPLKDNSLDEVFAHWVLEHFAYREIPNLLKEFKRVLKKGGLLHLVTNNGLAHIKAYQEKVIDIHELNRMIFGIALKRLPKSKITKNTPEHHYNYKMEDLHKIFWTEELVKYFFEPVFEKVVIRSTWKHRNENGKFLCPGIIIKAWV